MVAYTSVLHVRMERGAALCACSFAEPMGCFLAQLSIGISRNIYRALRVYWNPCFPVLEPLPRGSYETRSGSCGTGILEHIKKVTRENTDGNSEKYQCICVS